MTRRRKERSLKGKGGSQKNIKKPQHPVAVMERLNLHNPVIQVTHRVIVMITTAHHLMMIHPCRVRLHQQRLVLNIKNFLENIS